MDATIVYKLNHQLTKLVACFPFPINIKMKGSLLLKICGTPRAGFRRVHIEAKLAKMGLEMPTPAVPKGTFVNFLVIDNMAYLSGHLPQVSPLLSLS